jgi:molecular chaperone GrpE
MDDKRKKPLRPTTSDKLRDLQSAYFKDPGGREIPINSPDDNIEELELNDGNDSKLDYDPSDKLDTKDNFVEDNDSIKNETGDKSNTETELNGKILALEKEKEELKEQVMRKTAEIDNMRRRSLREKNDLIEYANEGIFQKLIPLIDDFTKAIESGQKSEDYNSLLQGIELIYQKTMKTFSDAGVKKMVINTGDKFDVDFHEALLQMPSKEINEGGILQVAQDGYMLYDKVLRHAKVITSAGSQDN